MWIVGARPWCSPQSSSLSAPDCSSQPSTSSPPESCSSACSRRRWPCRRGRRCSAWRSPRCRFDGSPGVPIRPLRMRMSRISTIAPTRCPNGRSWAGSSPASRPSAQVVRWASRDHPSTWVQPSARRSRPGSVDSFGPTKRNHFWSPGRPVESRRSSRHPPRVCSSHSSRHTRTTSPGTVSSRPSLRQPPAT